MLNAHYTSHGSLVDRKYQWCPANLGFVVIRCAEAIEQDENDFQQKDGREPVQAPTIAVLGVGRS